MREGWERREARDERDEKQKTRGLLNTNLRTGRVVYYRQAILAVLMEINQHVTCGLRLGLLGPDNSLPVSILLPMLESPAPRI